jgi:hypothetical protein
LHQAQRSIGRRWIPLSYVRCNRGQLQNARRGTEVTADDAAFPKRSLSHFGLRPKIIALASVQRPREGLNVGSLRESQRIDFSISLRFLEIGSLSPQYFSLKQRTPGCLCWTPNQTWVFNFHVKKERKEEKSRGFYTKSGKTMRR